MRTRLGILLSFGMVLMACDRPTSPHGDDVRITTSKSLYIPAPEDTLATVPYTIINHGDKPVEIAVCGDDELLNLPYIIWLTKHDDRWVSGGDRLGCTHAISYTLAPNGVIQGITQDGYRSDPDYRYDPSFPRTHRLQLVQYPDPPVPDLQFIYIYSNEFRIE